MHPHGQATSTERDASAYTAALDTVRLLALEEYGLLDTPREASFDAILRLATELCGAPVGMITLVAANRQWFKARTGIDEAETPLDRSICVHALQETSLLVIPDLTQDARTASLTSDGGSSTMRFYAGAPLRSTAGYGLGTLCVIDHMPRVDGLSAHQSNILRTLGDQVMNLFEARRALLAKEAEAMRLKASDAFLRGVLGASADCIKVLDLDGNLTFMNAPGLRAMEFDSFEAVEGKPWLAFWTEQDVPSVSTAVTSAQSGKVGRFSGWASTRFGDRKFWDVSVTPIMGCNGRIERLLAVSRDQTEAHDASLRQEALVSLGECLRDITDADEVAVRAAEAVGKTLSLTRAAFGSVDRTASAIAFARDWTVPGQRSVMGRHPYARYGTYINDLRRGACVSIADVRKDGRTASHHAALGAYGIHALLNVPVMEDGRLVGVLCLHDAVARTWTDQDTAFAKAIAEQARLALNRIAASEQQQLHIREVSHRFKNLLAMVQSIATQTMRSASDVQVAGDILAGRLAALGHAQDLLIDGNMGSSPLHDVVRNALRMHVDATTRLSVSGPEMLIGGKVALSLSLMLHELATNAAKYGAFSNAAGQVTLEWRIVGEGNKAVMRLTWVEHGGPTVVAPRHKGFGSRLIERGLAGQVGGSVELSYLPTGLSFLIEAPLAAFRETL